MTATNSHPGPAPPPPPPPSEGIACAQVRGGNERIDVPIDLPGMRGLLDSRPSDGTRGGDVYYLSVCGSGLLSRLCVADVVGHGEAVAVVSGKMHAMLQRFVSRPDHRRILRDLNRSLADIGIDAMTTAVMCTYYPPTHTLTFSYAGHPPGWFYDASARRWSRLDAADDDRAEGAFIDGALGISATARYTRTRRRVAVGDRLLLVTDGAFETLGPDGVMLGVEGLQAVLERHRDDPVEALMGRLRATIDGHRGEDAPVRDDVTILLVQFEPGPPGPALWHVVRNRVLRPLGVVDGGDGAER